MNKIKIILFYTNDFIEWKIKNYNEKRKENPLILDVHPILKS